MFFLIDYNLKIVFGWSAKCGCSHIKKIFKYLLTDDMNVQIHTSNEYNNLPLKMENYITIIFSRNPYKRIMSGFLDKYKTTGTLRHLWKSDKLTFSDFVDELLKNTWVKIDKHHFTPQTSEAFDKKIMLSKIVKFYDIENIDYEYI